MAIQLSEAILNALIKLQIYLCRVTDRFREYRVDFKIWCVAGFTK